MDNKLGELFIDGQIVNLDNSDISSLEEILKKVREERINEIYKIAKIINNI